MSPDESNGNGEGSDDEHPLKLAVDFNDWLQSRKFLSRALERLGRVLPPSGPGPAAELSQVLLAVDAELAAEREVWETLIRPRLTKYEGAPIPPLHFL
jgi:hypothetical protein